MEGWGIHQLSVPWLDKVRLVLVQYSDSWYFNGRVFVVVLFVIFTTQMFPQFYLVILASVKMVSRWLLLVILICCLVADGRFLILFRSV